MTIINRRKAIQFHYPDLQHDNGDGGDFLVQNRTDEGTDEFYWYSEEINKPTDVEMLQWTEEAEIIEKRLAEYPSIEELVVALYDTDDKSAVEAKRAAIKAKYPKP